MRALLYRPSWQVVRVYCMSKWSSRRGTEDNIALLTYYAHGTNDLYFKQLVAESRSAGYGSEHELAVRNYRVLAALNEINVSDIANHGDLIMDFRTELQSEQRSNYHELLTYANSKWDWSLVRAELAELNYALPGSFRSVLTQIKHEQWGAEHFTFLKLMAEVDRCE